MPSFLRKVNLHYRHGCWLSHPLSDYKINILIVYSLIQVLSIVFWENSCNTWELMRSDNLAVHCQDAALVVPVGDLVDSNIYESSYSQPTRYKTNGRVDEKEQHCCTVYTLRMLLLSLSSDIHETSSNQFLSTNLESIIY